jgi:hypothetical protein
MGEQDLRLDVLAQRRLDADEVLEQLMAEHAVDRAHAIGPLGMTRTGQVVEEARVRDEERCHRPASNWGFGGVMPLKQRKPQGGIASGDRHRACARPSRLSWSSLSRPSSHPRAPEQSESWILGTSPRMTTAGRDR